MVNLVKARHVFKVVKTFYSRDLEFDLMILEFEPDLDTKKTYPHTKKSGF